MYLVKDMNKNRSTYDAFLYIMHRWIAYNFESASLS